MNKIKWCFEQKKGIKLIEPNLNISKSYKIRAENDLNNILKQDDVWKVIISYYSCYNALYSVLIRYGLKCEIHDCSIKLMSFFEHLNNYSDFMNELKENRINTQYYLEEPEPVNINEIKSFINACKLELTEVNNNKIKEIKTKIKERII